MHTRYYTTWSTAWFFAGYWTPLACILIQESFWKAQTLSEVAMHKILSIKQYEQTQHAECCLHGKCAHCQLSKWGFCWILCLQQACDMTQLLLGSWIWQMEQAENNSLILGLPFSVAMCVQTSWALACHPRPAKHSMSASREVPQEDGQHSYFSPSCFALIEGSATAQKSWC